MKRLILLSVALLAGCATPPPISTNPIQTVTNAVAATPIGGTVVTGLQNAAFNLDSAVQIGVLPMNDPADGCVHGALQLIGQDVVLGPMGENPVTPVTPTKQFTPKVTDLLSGGSVAYILAQQAKQIAGGGVTVPASCEQLVGHFVLTGVNAPANTVINAVLKGLP